MPHAPLGSGYWPYLIPLVLVVVAVVRNSRTRNLRVGRLWVTPTTIILVTVFAFGGQPPPSPGLLAAEIAAVGAGAALGWWRGRSTRIALDPETDALTRRTSRLGLLLILGIFALRYGLQTVMSQNSSLLHVTAVEVTDVLLLLAVGLVSAQRLEIALRATGLRKAARATATPPA